jgi:predicted nucleic acid-binding protein
MTVLVDTSVLAAFLNPADERHGDARKLMARIMRGELGVPVSTEFILAEGLTLLRKRPGSLGTSKRYAALFLPGEGLRPPLVLHATTRQEVEKAAQLHIEAYDRKLSLPDCHLVILASDLGATIASFDKGFDGMAPRVEA